MGSSIIVPIVTGILGLIGSIFGGIVLIRQSDIKKDTEINREKIETAKTEALTKVEVAKTAADAENDKLNIAFNTQQKLVESQQGVVVGLSKDLRQLRKEFSDVRSNFDICQNEKLELKSKITDVEIENKLVRGMIQDIKKYNSLLIESIKDVNPKLYVKVREKMLENGK